MKLAIYTRDEVGFIEFLGVQEWGSVNQMLAYWYLDGDTPEVEDMLGWPDAKVTWHRHTGYAVR